MHGKVLVVEELQGWLLWEYAKASCASNKANTASYKMDPCPAKAKRISDMVAPLG